MNKQKKAFTLVELIVVITILGILSTIGFVSYSSYLTGVRDANRISNLKALSDGLELFSLKNTLPLPDDYIEIKVNGEVIGFQGYAGLKIIKTIDFSSEGTDPKDGTYYSYYLTKDKKYYQLMGFLEEETDLQTAGIFNKTNALDYSIKYPTVYGKKLGILTGTGTDLNVPIQEILNIKNSGYLDVGLTNNEYIARFTDGSQLSGTGLDLQYLENIQLAGGIASSCKILLDRNTGLKGKDGTYLINPEGNDPFAIYCDMTKDGGGWSLIGLSSGSWKFNLKGVNKLNIDDIDNGYGLWLNKTNFIEMNEFKVRTVINGIDKDRWLYGWNNSIYLTNILEVGNDLGMKNIDYSKHLIKNIKGSNGVLAMGDMGAGDLIDILNGVLVTGDWGKGSNNDGYFSFYGVNENTTWGMDTLKYSIAFGIDDSNYGYCFNDNPLNNIYQDNLGCENTELYDSYFYIR